MQDEGEHDNVFILPEKGDGNVTAEEHGNANTRSSSANHNLSNDVPGTQEMHKNSSSNA